MKKIFRKNQLVITALALMIAVAGYFSYMNSNVEDEEAAASASSAETSASSGEVAASSAGTSASSAEVADDADMLEYEISDEDALLEGEIFTDEGDVTADADADGELAEADGASEDMAETSADADGTAETSADATTSADAETSADADVDGGNPGEAVLTSTTVANLDYAAEMKLNREQVRSKNKEMLLEIVNNEAIEESLKQDAVNKMIAMTDIAEREAAAEMLLEAKGFTDVVVSITDDSCDVVLNMGEVTDAKRAQVEDIVKRKTNVTAENIVITPIVLDGEGE